MVRSKTLKDEQTKLASILNVFNKQIEKIQEMTAQLSALKEESERYLQGNNFDPLTISNYAMYVKKFQEDIELQKAVNKKTKEVLDAQQLIVKKAYIGVKSLENLKDKQKEQYLKEIQMEEIKEIDDIINSRRNIA